MHTRAAIRPPALVMRLVDAPDQLPVLPRSGRWPPAPVRVETGAGDAHHAAKRHDRELRLLRLDKRELHVVSLAKKAVVSSGGQSNSRRVLSTSTNGTAWTSGVIE